MYPEVFKTREIFADSDFFAKLFDACIANYFDLNNPIRFNNFAYSIRELLREKLDLEAPDSFVKDCLWFKESEKITRGDRIRYLMGKGLTDNVIHPPVLKKMYQAKKRLLNQYEILNKYTHINEKSFGIDNVEGDKKFRQLLDSLTTCFELIADVEESIKNDLIDSIRDDIESQLYDQLPSEIDSLSTHTGIESVDGVKIEIEKIDSQNIAIIGSCSVNVELQYGSDSDCRNDLGGYDSDSYPMKFRIDVSASNLAEREYILSEIDTSSFYGPEEDR